MPLPTPDLVAPFDPTAYSSISGAQLLQLVSGLTPYDNRGLIIVTTDDEFGVPDVPDAAVYDILRNYFWLRISVTAATPYVWNNAASNHTDGDGNNILKWYTIASASIGVGTITNEMIANNTIQDGKIANLSYSKLIGAPTGLPPSGAAGGDLTGTYPNPSIAPLSITTGKIALLNVTNALIAAYTIDATTKIAPNATGLTQLRTNAGATALEFFVPNVIVNLTNPSGSDALKLVRVNAAGTGYEKTGPVVIQTLAKSIANAVALATAIPADATPPQNTEGTEIATLTITPTSATSILRIRVAGSIETQGDTGTLAVFKTGTADALQAQCADGDSTGDSVCLCVEHYILAGSTAAQTFTARAGRDGGASVWNPLFSTSGVSFFTVEEISCTLT